MKRSGMLAKSHPQGHYTSKEHEGSSGDNPGSRVQRYDENQTDRANIAIMNKILHPARTGDLGIGIAPCSATMLVQLAQPAITFPIRSDLVQVEPQRLSWRR